MRCPYCGSRALFWDYKGGFIVCQSCGSVVDRIYVHQSENSHEEISRPAGREKIIRRGIGKYMHLFRERRRGCVVVEDQARLYIDTGGKKMVGTMVRRDTPEMLARIASRNPLIFQILTAISEHPRLASRTLRVKVALALYILSRLHFANYSLPEIARITGTNLGHLREAKRYIDRSPHFIRDLKRRIVVWNDANEEGDNKKPAQ